MNILCEFLTFVCSVQVIYVKTFHINTHHNRMTEAETTDFYKSVDRFRKSMQRLYEKKEKELQKYHKTKVGKKQKKAETSYKWWGFNTPQDFKIFENKNDEWLDELIHWKQDDKNTHQLPIREHKSQYVQMNQIDLKSMGTVCETQYYYGRLKIKDAKFNNNLPLTKPQDLDTKTKEFNGDVKYVGLGDIEQVDTDSNRCIYNLYRAIKIPIDRQPYIPDFSLEITQIHGTGIRLYLRSLVYGIACVVKCNVILKPHQKEIRKEMCKNHSKHWYEAKQLSQESLFSLFLHQYDSASKTATYVGNSDYLREMLEFLLKDDSFDTNSHWLTSASGAIETRAGYSVLDSFYGVWRHKDDARDEKEDWNDDWMYGLLNYIYPNECLCSIKCIQFVASRIASILASTADHLYEDDGLLIVKCVELMLQICDKGDISGWHSAFMPLPGYYLDYAGQRHLKDALHKLDVSTTVILESLRTIGDLGAFDLKFVIQNQKLHKVWYMYFVWALIGLLNNLVILQTILPVLMKHVKNVKDGYDYGMYMWHVIR